MKTQLTQHLQAAGLLVPPPAASSLPSSSPVVGVSVQARALEEAIAPHWPAFMECWLSPELRQATREHPGRAAEAWALAMPPSMVLALESSTGAKVSALLAPWVSMLSWQRHAQLPASATQLLDGWVRMLAPEPGAGPSDFWETLATTIRHADSQRDREWAQEVAIQVAPQLAEVVRGASRRQGWGWVRLKMLWRGVAALLPLLPNRPVELTAAAQVIERAMHPLAPHVDPEQAFPALAMALETLMARELALPTSRPVYRVALEHWLSQAIALALPHVLPNRLYVPAVRLLVRQALHLDSHPQALVPEPILRQAE